jgi:protein-disulfide isomerase
MRFVARALVLTIVLFIIACGGSPTTPKVPDDLSVGPAKGTNAMPVATGNEEASSDGDAEIPITREDPVRGDRNALVTLVVFSDFQCPFCGRLVSTALDRIREEYTAEDLRIVFKNEPLSFHTHARLAAEVGQGVFETRGADAFWRYHDLAFRSQKDIGPDAIRQWAIEAGADPREIDGGIEAKRWKAKIDRDVELANKIGATGTPASFINGVSLSGAQPYDKFKQLIDAERDKAKALLESGVPRGRLYAKAVAANYKAPNTQRDDPDESEDTKTVWKVPVGSAPVRGKSTALVTIVEFADFQCPYCKRVEPTLAQLRSDYGDKIRIVWKDEPLPFHPRALPAANLARFARSQKGDAAFWDVHDRLFDRQPALEDMDLELIARAAGIDAARAMTAVSTKQFQKQIDADVDLGDDIQASGTPHFFINGRRLVGAHPVEKFKRIIDEEIKKSEALVKSGVAANAVYDTIIASGKAAPEPEVKVIPLSATAPFRGAPNAPVVIQEFSDFQCPFCQRVEPTLDELLKAYPGKIKLVWRDLPLPMHPNAPLAAEAGREAFAQKGNEGFQKMRTLMFANQQNLDRAGLEGFAKQIGLDMARFKKALDTHVHKADVEADAKVANDKGINGTPAFVVGQYFLSGAQPLSKFKKLVDRTLNPPKVVPAPNGLVVNDLSLGSGAAAKSGDTLVVHYVGTLTDGTLFDSSRTRNQTFSFELGKGMVIKGWDQGLVGMKVGGKRKLIIPPDLAYGDRGVSGKIPPKSTLVFEVELVSIK